ncbi:hypothetical protein ABVT39_022916 [Epinephelus coioides]
MVKPKAKLTTSSGVQPRKLDPVRKFPRCHVAELILKAVCAYQDRKGISTKALKKELAALDIDVEANNRVIKSGINWLLSKKAIVHATLKGIGAMGSFKRGDAAELIAVKLAAEVRRAENAKAKLPKKSEAGKNAAK